MRRDDQVLSLLSLKGFPLFSCIKDSLIGLRTPRRCYQLVKKKKREGGGAPNKTWAHTCTRLHMFGRDAKESTRRAQRWLKESKHHFAWRNNICRGRVTWDGLWGNMFALLSFLSCAQEGPCDETKTIKSEFLGRGPPCQLTSPWWSSQEERETPPPVS